MSNEGKSTALAHELLGLLLNRPVQPPAGGYFLGLGSTIPANGTFTELTGNNYARVGVPPSVWGEPSNRQISNVADITFPIAQTAPWLSALSQGLYRANTGGAPDLYGILESGVINSLNGGLFFDAGDLSYLESKEIQNKSAIEAHKVLSLLRGDAILPPEQLWIGLGTARTIANDNINEIAALPRVRYYVGTAFWEEPAQRRTRNLQEIVFAKAPQNLPDSWSFGIFYQQTGGTPARYGTVDSAMVVRAKDKLRILVNGLVVRE